MRIKIFRILVCLLLICSLMVSISPIQAEALSPGLAFAAGSAVASILIGLGISMGSDAFAHSELVQNAVSHLETAGGFITDGMISILNLGNGKYGLSLELIHTLRNWILGNNIVYRSSHVSNSSYTGTFNNRDYTVTSLGQNCVVAAVTYVVYTAGASAPYKFVSRLRVYAQNSGNIKIEGQSGFIALTRSSNGYYYYDINSSQTNLSSLDGFAPSVSGSFSVVELGQFMDNSTAKSVFDAYNPFNVETDFVTDYDVQLNFIGDPELSLAEGYPEWHANSVVIDGETYYPVALAPTYEGTQSMTQEDVWAGNGTYVDSEVVPGTGSGTVTVPDNATLKDILTGVLAIPQAISIAVSNVVAAVQAIPAAVQAIPAAITDFFTITAEDLAIPVTWTDFFPFCIPWDIYELVTVLDAEPEAPHFVFDVNFPYMTEPWHIDIDFSAWDPVALVLRRLELLLFIVGLAMATRNYYIRG